MYKHRVAIHVLVHSRLVSRISYSSAEALSLPGNLPDSGFGWPRSPWQPQYAQNAHARTASLHDYLLLATNPECSTCLNTPRVLSTVACLTRSMHGYLRTSLCNVPGPYLCILADFSGWARNGLFVQMRFSKTYAAMRPRSFNQLAS